MPDTQRIDVDYARDSIAGDHYEVVIVGVHSDTGILIIPDETVPIIVEYGYWVSVSNGDMHVVLDDDVVRTVYRILEEGGSIGEEVVLRIEKATEDDLNERQAAVIGDNYAVSVTLTVNGEYVSELGGVAEISLEPGFEAVYVYHVLLSGELEPVDCTYDPETGMVDFAVDHFSIYMIKAENHEEPWSVSPFLIGLIALLLILISVAYPYRAERRYQ